MTNQLILTFISGGIICVIAQLLIDLTRLTPARILVLYVSVGVLLFAVGVFEPMEKIFGSGVTVPLIGFGSAVARGVREAVMNDGFLGVIGGAFSAMGKGCAAALICGFTASLLVKGKSKKM